MPRGTYDLLQLFLVRASLSGCLLPAIPRPYQAALSRFAACLLCALCPISSAQSCPLREQSNSLSAPAQPPLMLVPAYHSLATADAPPLYT